MSTTLTTAHCDQRDPAPSSSMSLEALPPYDVVVIGSGAGGATLAHRLTRNGVRVLLIEAGGWLPPRGPNGGTYIGDYYPDRSVPIEAVGGQTLFYGAALYRFRESDFLPVEHECGTTPGWPLSYAELSPWYDEVEQLYRVHGDPSADATEPSRQRTLPNAALPHSPVVARMIDRLKAAGASPAPIPRSIFWNGGAGPCTLCANCDAHMCPIDAKGNSATAAIAPALATGRLTLLTGTRAIRVLTDPSGHRAIGVEVERHGDRTIIPAETIAVCGGLEATVALLRRSRNASHAKGLGNSGGALGRYLAGHSTGMIFPFVSLKRQPEQHTKTFAMNQYYHGNGAWPWPMGVIQMSGQMPMWREVGLAIKPIAHLLARHALTAFYMTEALPTRDSGFQFDGDRLGAKQEPVHNLRTFRAMRHEATRLFRRAGYPVLARRRSPYLWHETGGARMGDDPATSVVDRNLAVHGIAGLYVADASVLPSAGAVNTGLTIMALAARLGDHLASGISGFRMPYAGDSPLAEASRNS